MPSTASEARFAHSSGRPITRCLQRAVPIGCCASGAPLILVGPSRSIRTSTGFEPQAGLLTAALWPPVQTIGPLSSFHATRRSQRRHSHLPLCLSFSPDGKFLCVGCESGAVKICDAVYGRDVATVQIGETIKSIEWAVNPHVVIAATREGSVALIDPIRWTPVVSRQLLPCTHVSLGLRSFRAVAQHSTQVHPDLLIAAYDIDVAENGSLSLVVENSSTGGYAASAGVKFHRTPVT
jgi:WD40 repeat protein